MLHPHLLPTGRELEILKCIAAGLSSKQIASKLFISKHTVDSHRKNLLLKLGAKSSGELVQLYIRKFLK